MHTIVDFTIIFKSVHYFQFQITNMPCGMNFFYLESLFTVPNNYTVGYINQIKMVD